MKKILCCALIFACFMLVLPLSVMGGGKKDKASAISASAKTNINKVNNIPAQSDTFRLLNRDTNTVSNISAENYIFGVVAAEMPALYEYEALKAQAVAAYTFACRRRLESGKKDYDITTDPKTDQSFAAAEELKKRWGDKADVYTEKIKKAVADTKGQVLTYNGEPALTVYHAVSSGMTNACRDVWGKDLPYLKSVASPYDKLAPNYLSSVTVSGEDFCKKLAGKCTFSGNKEKYIGEIKRTDTGAVKTVCICGKEISGGEIRSAFDLRSLNFDITLNNGNFVFTVRGYGHGVGMSQFGADYMAKQGSTYKEILATYYKGLSLSD